MNLQVPVNKNLRNLLSLTSVITLLMILFLPACHKDIDEFEPYDGIVLKQRLLFSVEDIYQKPLAGVEVFFDDKYYRTDENGIIYIHETTIKRGLHPVTFRKEGYYNSVQGIDFLSQNKTKVIRASMVEIQRHGPYKADLEENITIDKFRFSIPAGIFEREIGGDYSGEYTIALNYIPMKGREIYRFQQGHSSGRRKNKAEVAFENFGQFQIKFYDNNGDQLLIKSEHFVGVEFNHDPELETELLRASPIWKLDEASAVWLEYDFTEYQPGTFAFELKDGGIYMLAAAFPPARVSGRVASANGRLFTDDYIDIINIDGTVHSLGLDSDGEFSLILPQNEDMDIQVRNSCGDLVGENELGVFHVKTDVGDILFPADTEYRLKITTTDCMNNPINAGYFILHGKERDIVYMPPSSNVNIQWVSCTPNDFSTELISYFNIRGTKSTILYDKSINADIGTIHGCNQIFKNEWLIVEDNNKTLIEDFHLTEEGNDVLASANLPEGEIKIRFNKESESLDFIQHPSTHLRVENSYFLMEKFRGDTYLISYKALVKNENSEQFLHYGRIRTEIRN